MDNIHRDADGRVRYHYTIIDFAARWDGGTAVAGGDVSRGAMGAARRARALLPLDEAHRVIAIARRLVGC